MSIKIFYHIYCNHLTFPIVKDQITKIIYSGLYEEVSSIYCFVTGQPEYMDLVCSYIENSGAKFKIPKRIPYDTTYERYTLLDIPKYITPEDKFLYIHSKGVQHTNEFEQMCVYDWRNLMEYFLIAKYKNCIELLNEYNIAGVNGSPYNNPDHYSGNFWWSTGAYYLTLDFENLKNDVTYNGPELFIFNNKPKAYNIYSSYCNNNKNTSGHYTELYPMIYYIDK